MAHSKKGIKIATMLSKRDLMLAGIIPHRNRKFVDITGYKYGRWTVLRRVKNRGRMIYWECVCECGVVKEVPRIALRSGASKSCGCFNLEVISSVDHGMTGTPEYTCWCGMKHRCYNHKDSHWENYGGRGIKVCERWLNSFENFYADIGPRPDGMTIERIDVNGDYEPSNCKWIPARDQHRNKTNSRRLTAFGREQLLVDWARELNMDISQLHYHLERKNMEQIIEWWTKPLLKVCENCGAAFSTIKKKQIFCSDSAI